MKACFVCAAAWESNWKRCGNCETDLDVLEGLAEISERPRFLFGSVRQAKPEPPPVEAPPKPSPRPRPAPKVVKKPEAAPPPVAEDEILSVDDPVLDVQTWEAGDARERRLTLVLTYLADLVFCLGLNSLVFRLILWVSDRGLVPLVNLSLIPLLFVLLGFTVLYFWMFLNSFDKTLGGIVAEKLAARFRKPAS